MTIKKGDNVIVITGKSKGTKGKVLQVIAGGKVIVDGVNKVKKHQKARAGATVGQIIEKMLPINASNVMIVDPKSGKQTLSERKWSLVKMSALPKKAVKKFKYFKIEI